MATSRLRLRKLSDPTIGRLPLYQRIVEGFLHRGITRIESNQIAALTGVTATTVRRDLAGLGQLGTRGSGYDVETLDHKIGEALGHDRSYSVVVVGMGNLGHALVNSSNFLIRGASLAALYDADPAVIGTTVAGKVIQSIVDDIAPATVGVICTPADAAQAVADKLVQAKVPAILNFAPTIISVPLGVAVHYVDFSIEMQILVFHLLNTVHFSSGALHTVDGPPSRPSSAAP